MILGQSNAYNRTDKCSEENRSYNEMILNKSHNAESCWFYDASILVPQL